MSSSEGSYRRTGSENDKTLINYYILSFAMKFFSICSLPFSRKGQDQLFSDYTAKHLVVSKGGHFYAFDVTDSDGKILIIKGTNFRAD